MQFELKIGSSVRVVDGTFTGCFGTILSLLEDKAELQLSIFGRRILHEIPITSLVSSDVVISKPPETMDVKFPRAGLRLQLDGENGRMLFILARRIRVLRSSLAKHWWPH